MQKTWRIVFGGQILVAEFRMGGQEFFKAATFRGFRQGYRHQAHPEQRERVVILLRRAMMVGEAANPAAHALGSAGSVGGLQVEPGDAEMFAVMKLVRWKRKILEGAQKIFIAPGRCAGAKIGVGHMIVK